MLAELLSRTPSMGELSEDEARVVSALRFWVAANSLGRCPIGAAAARLDSKRAAAHLHLLLEEVRATWPEPFVVSPRCCSRLSPDEAVMAQMVALAGQGDRPGFDRLLSDMLPGDVRERLFLSATVLSRVLRN